MLDKSIPDGGGHMLGSLSAKTMNVNLNVRDEFENIMSESNINQQSSFAFKQTYLATPNPGLNLADLGIIGLPLSAKGAELVKARCVQAPFGMGERTVVDTTVRDTWEMDAGQVTFMNPHWKQFLTSVVAEVCKTLRVNVEASKPRAELYKLLLYETGSHFLPHVDTEKADGMFATIIIVLPSKFTGGAVHLSHGDKTVVYDCSATSQFETTVLSWYTDVTHEVKPITSGYRLALSYNLMHTTRSVPPTHLTNAALSAKLSALLQAWARDTSGDTPQKLVYLLEHKYSEAGLRGSALKGVDAATLALLHPVAREHGFGLGLAHAHCHLTGYAEERERGVEFGEVENREMTIENFVDLDGEVILDKLQYEWEEETIPIDLTEDVEAGECDDEDYQGYTGNDAGSLERWYRRTVLIIWPPRSNANILYSDARGFSRACEDLALFLGEHPTPSQLALIDFVLEHCARDPGRAANVVAQGACVRGDLELWTRTVERCAVHAGAVTLCAEFAREAVEGFGFDAVRPSFELMLKNDSHNGSRLELLSLFTGEPWEALTSDEDRVEEQHRLAKAWAVPQVQEVLSTLKKPVVTECDALLNAVHNLGGITVLKNCVLPQLLAIADDDFLRGFSTKVFHDPQLPTSEEKSSVISALLAAAISKATIYTPPPPPPKPEDFYSYLKPFQPPAPPFDPTFEAKRYTQLCFDLRCLELVASVVDRALNAPGLSPADVQDCVTTVLVPLFTTLLTLSADPPTRHAISPALQRTLTAYITHILGPAPSAHAALAASSHQISGWMCNCDACTRAKAFLTQPGKKTTTLGGIGASERKHVEGMLVRHAKAVAIGEKTGGVPRDLLIRKTAALDARAAWKAKQVQGAAMLTAVSTDEEGLKRLLASEYDNITSVLRGRAKPTPENVEAGAQGASAARPSARRMDSDTGLPPTKKRKMISTSQHDIIDLT